MFALNALFRFFIRQGTLRVMDANGKEHLFVGTDAPHATIRIHDPSLYWKILLMPHLALGEGYMDGTLTVEEGTLYDFLHLLSLNQRRLRQFPTAAFIRKILIFLSFAIQHNPVGKAKKKIAHHYDLSNDLYKLFLDEDMQYSCAYFKTGKESIDQAQADKKEHIIKKLFLADGMRVLDIGCGWGGLALEIAKRYDVRIVGVTLSQEQYELARQRVAEQGLEAKIDIRLTDYRDLTETFDRIVSIGMFEHVGKPHYEEFFQKTRRLLSDNGSMLLHSIGNIRPIYASNPWVEKHIFPGGYAPALSECIPVIERSDFWITDIEILRKHYAYTLRAWKENLLANRDAVVRMKGEVFFRMWEMYLTGFEVGFMFGELMVFQMQLTKNIDAAPITRDYMYAPTSLVD